MRTCSKTQKYSIAHNFFSFDRNIGMLHLVSIVLMRGIQLKKNFSNWSYPVLTTTQNDEKLHIFSASSASCGRYASCVHAGGLSCFGEMFTWKLSRTTMKCSHYDRRMLHRDTSNLESTTDRHIGISKPKYHKLSVNTNLSNAIAAGKNTTFCKENKQSVTARFAMRRCAVLCLMYPLHMVKITNRLPAKPKNGTRRLMITLKRSIHQT